MGSLVDECFSMEIIGEFIRLHGAGFGVDEDKTCRP